MSEKTADRFKDMLPRTEEVLVGDTVLLLEELSMDRWEEFTEVMAQAVEWARRLQPLANLLRNGSTDAAAVAGVLLANIEALGEAAADVLKDLLGKRVPAIVVGALATTENARRLGLDDVIKPVLTIRQKLTVRQAIAALEALVRVTDVADVVGKSRSLTREVREAFRRTAGTQASAA